MLGWAMSETTPMTRDLAMRAFGTGTQYGILLPYSRHHESEADSIGIQLMAKAGYDPSEAPLFWGRFGNAKAGSESPPEWASTHPSRPRRFAFNSGEVCTCPSRALIQESIYERFMARALERVKAIKAGNPLDSATMLGAQNSAIQLERILAYLKVGKDEGAEVLAGGDQLHIEGGGFYVQPTVFKGHNQMRVFREEIFGPVLCVTTFKTEAEALALANDTPYGLGAGVWTRDVNTMFRMGRGIKAGRVWCNNYHAYPAHAGACGAAWAGSGGGRGGGGQATSQWAAPQDTTALTRLALPAPTRPACAPSLQPRPRSVRRLQGERLRARDVPHGAQRVPADQEPARVDVPQGAGLLLRKAHDIQEEPSNNGSPPWRTTHVACARAGRTAS